MEELVEEGKIQYYGISSNTFPADPGRRDFVSLVRIWEAYEQVKQELKIKEDRGHFAVIQLPFNWLENEAHVLKNNKWQSRKYTVLELAQKFKLGVLINRPLNAIRGDNLLRLVKYNFNPQKNYEREVDEKLEELQSFEKVIIRYIREWNIDIDDYFYKV